MLLYFTLYDNKTERFNKYYMYYLLRRGWSGGAKVLGKLLVPGRPTNLDYSRARAYCACSRCGWGCLDIFLFSITFRSPSLWETARYRLKYCLKGPLSPKQPTNQPTYYGTPGGKFLSDIYQKRN